jgi:hypothetical protein
VAGTPGQLRRECRVIGHRVGGALRGELDAAGAGEYLRGVGGPEDRREADPETTDGVTVALSRRAQCGQRGHAGGVQRRAAVRGP